MLPHTLPGIIGFILLSSFMIGIVTTVDTNSAEINSLQSELSNKINDVLNNKNDSILTKVLDVGSVFFSTLSLLFNFMFNFVTYSIQLPVQFSIFFLIIFVLGIIAIIKFIRGVWDL